MTEAAGTLRSTPLRHVPHRDLPDEGRLTYVLRQRFSYTYDAPVRDLDHRLDTFDSNVDRGGVGNHVGQRVNGIVRIATGGQGCGARTRVELVSSTSWRDPAGRNGADLDRPAAP